MMKKLAIGVVCLALLFLSAAIALPIFVNVDKFRPQIVQVVNDHINGEFKLGKLELSLWGGIKVRIESLSIQAKDSAHPILETNSAYIEIPLLSLLTMSPTMDVVLDRPKIDIVKNRAGKMNVMMLMKESSAPAAAPAKPEPGGGSSGLPAIAASASLGFRIDKGAFVYNDETSGNKVTIDDVEFIAEHLGLKNNVKINFKMPIKVSTATEKISAPIEVHASLETNFVGSTTSIKIDSMEIRLDDLALGAKGLVNLTPAKSVNMNISTTQFHLAKLGEIVPMVKAYQLGGDLDLAVNVDGPVEQLAIKGDLGIRGGKAAYPAMLKAPIGFDLKSEFTDKSFHLAGLTVTGPAISAVLKGDVQNFSAPQFSFALNAKEIDVDKLLKADSTTKKSASWVFSPIDFAEASPVHAKVASKSTGKGKTHSAPHADTAAEPIASHGENPMLGLAKNPIVANAAGTFTANISKLVAKGAPITNVAVKAELKKMVLTIESASLKAFDGTLAAKAEANMRTSGLNFSTSGTVKGLQAKPALAAFVPKFQNSLEGKMSANWRMAGIAFPRSALMHGLSGTVSVTAENGQLHSIDLKDSIKGVLSGVSFLKSVNPPNIDQGFKSMRADLKFNGGIITADPLEVIGDSKGVNIKGKSTIQESMTQDTYVDVFDPNHLLPKEISNGKDAAMQLHITGPVSSPQTDYGYTTSRLAKNVMRNQGQDLINQQLKKALGGKNIPGGQNAVGDALKKLGF